MNKMRIRLVLAIFGFLLITSTEARAIEDEESTEVEEATAMLPQPRESGNSQIQAILKFLNEGEKSVKLAPQHDVIILLGNTGSGKSTLTLFLTGYDDQLISKEVGEGEYIIEDRNNKISTNSTITSQTIFPDLVLDARSKIPYYDCPGFMDTRSAAHDIAAIYFIKKVLDNSGAVKLVFTVSYPSVRPGVDRQDFMLLIRHIVGLVKNVVKYKNSMSLVVTKVDNQIIKIGQQYKLVSDKTMIGQIAKFIEGVSHELEGKVNSTTVTTEEKEFLKKAVIFTQTLLFKEGDEYLRLAIFRRPDKIGPLSKIQLLQDGKVTMKKVIDVNTHYTATARNDFGYTISAESKNHVHDLTREIITEITSEAAKVGKEIQQYYNGQEKQIRDVYVLYEKFKLGHSTFSSIKSSSGFFEPTTFVETVTKAIESLNVQISKQSFSEILKYDGYLKFLQTVSGQTSTSQMPNGLANLIDYLNLSEKWYNFLINLYKILSEYDVQRDRTRFDTHNLKQQISLGQNQRIKVDQTDTEKLLNKANVLGYKTGYNDIKFLELDKWKAEMLKGVLDLTLDYTVASTCATPDKVVVKGQYIKLSELHKVNCSNKEIKFMEIYALEKVFIDTDFDKTGSRLQLSIIAPTWHMVNNPKIILGGKPGEVHKEPKAAVGDAPGSNGQDGKPGHSGGPAGNFLGIGEDFINARTLLLSANGGKGSDGQGGGDGSSGKNGEDPPRSGKLGEWRSNGFKPACEFRIGGGGPFAPPPPANCKLYGKPGGAGGNGGNGGIAGLGGYEGNVTVIGVLKDAGISWSNKKGENGKGGDGGSAGPGGRDGETIEVYAVQPPFRSDYEFRNLVHVYPPNSRPYGTAGRSSANENEKDSLESPIPLFNRGLSIKNYKQFLKENSHNSIRQSFLMSFLLRMETNRNVLNIS